MKMKRKPTPVAVRSGQVEFVKVNTDAWRWRDVYRWLLSLRWPQFAAFSMSIVIAPLNGKPTLMVRVGNENHHSMVEAEFRIMFSRDEPLIEGGDFRYFYHLKLQFDRLTIFPAALTLRHTIDEKSPLF